MVKEDLPDKPPKLVREVNYTYKRAPRVEDPNTQVEDPNVRQSCCFTIDIVTVLLLGALLMSFLTIFFTFFMLIRTINDCSAQQTYSTILCTIIGVWLPSPTATFTRKRHE